ncbi:hypothetical protein [Neobacillus niacini]|uniref:hypothetical protein n=1 Tax=Neobacillus niacini TaxID=86668 RepID=UPI00285AE27F|nr:hypothetical protein [Neobacillus niacini]MDR7001541.1 hypothetical protein [Neobacillus niacini]
MAVIVSDSFNRADSTTGLGTTDSYNGGTAKTWQYRSGSVFGILGNVAYPYSGTNPVIAYVDCGQSDVTINVTAIQSNTSDYFMAVMRYDPTTNTGLIVNGNPIKIQSFSGSTFTNIATTSIYNAANDVFKIVLSGTSISVYRNGTLIVSGTSTINQTKTNHGLSSWRGSTTAAYGRWDNFYIEDSGTPTGTDGSTAFDLRQSLYLDGAVSTDLRQSLYSDSFTSFDTFEQLYVDSTVQTDIKQAIYNDSATGYDTRQSFYSDASSLFDTLQEFFSGGIDGSTPFDIRMVLYADNAAVFDSKQAVYSDITVSADLAQQFYQVGVNSTDLKLVIYADASSKFDANQTIYSDVSVKADTAQRFYSDGALDFDMLQAILEDWNEYHEVIQIVLNITQNKSATLGITQRMQSKLKM